MEGCKGGERIKGRYWEGETMDGQGYHTLTHSINHLTLTHSISHLLLN